MQLLSKDFLKLVAIAFMLAVPVSWWTMNQWLEDYPYRIEIQWWMFAIAVVLTFGLAGLTVGVQGFRAALENPAKVLKDE